MKSPLWLPIVMATLALGCSGAEEAPTSPTTLSGEFTFASTVGVGGTASRVFATTGSGSITASLMSVSPSLLLGVGIGIPRATGTNCDVTRAIETIGGDGRELTIAAEAGTYCVKVFDLGQIDDLAAFSVRVTHP
jgi:hypothetical protein